MPVYERVHLHDIDEKPPLIIPKSSLERVKWILIVLLTAIASGLGFLTGSRATCKLNSREIAGDISGFVPKCK
jgi:hypothetical protein